jgi:hypothetical protein
LSYSDLVHPYCDFCLLGPTDLFPQEPSLLVKELVHEDEVGYHMIQ